MRLIYNSDAQRLQKNFDDKTPVTVSELFRSERTASVPIELFLVDNDGGYATPGSSDYEVLIGRQAQAVTTGKLTLTFTGTTEEIDLSKPKLATRIEAALNAVSEVNAAGGVDVVELKNGRAFQITFRSVGSRAAITAGVKDSMQPASVLISEVTAGTGSTREVQLLTLEEASLAEISTSGWSANSNPTLTITTLVEGTANTREVVQLSVSNDPAPGSFFVVSNSEPISTEATAAQVKTILNSALSNDIGSVKKTGERIWQITYKTNGDKTALSAGTHNLVKRPSVNATLSLNTTALAYAANSDGSDLSVGFTLKKSNEVLLSENVDLAEPFAEVIGSSAMLNNDSLGALFTIAGDDVNKGTAISLSGGLTYSSDTLAAPFLPLAGGTMTGNAVFNDNVKAIFGTSSDGLEILHDGSNSIIKDSGTGDLIIQGSDDIWLRTEGGQNYARFAAGGAVELRYANSTKLNTESFGCTISGKLVVNGDLDVSGTTTTFNSTVVTVDDPVFTVGGDTAPVASDNKDRGIEFRYFRSGESAKVGFFGYSNADDAFKLLTSATNNSEVFSGTLADLKCGKVLLEDGSASEPSLTFSNDSDTGFYHAGGAINVSFNTQQRWHWTADFFRGAATLSAEISSQAGSASSPNYRFRDDNNTGIFRADADTLAFTTGGTEAARFDSDGDFIINNSNEIKNDTSHLRFSTGSQDNNDIVFKPNGTLQMTLTDTGLLGIGGTPSEKLTVDGNIRINGDNKELYFSGNQAKFRTSSASSDVIFETGTTELLRLDGSASSINVPDNVKLNFGAGDLRIFHDGSNSYIQDDSGTGDLIVNTNAFRLKSANNSESMITAFEDGAVNVMHNDITRLSTTSSGININGGITFDSTFSEIIRSPNSLRINIDNDGNQTDRIFIVSANSGMDELFRVQENGKVGIGGVPSAPLDIISSATGGTTIELDNTSTGGRNWTLYSSGSGNSFGAGNFALYDADAASTRFLIDSSGNVGIGNTNPSAVLHVSGGSATIPSISTSFPFVVSNSTNSGLCILTGDTTSAGQLVFGDTDASVVGRIRYQHSDNSLRFWTNFAERMRIDSNGNVGINETAPSLLSASTKGIHITGTNAQTKIESDNDGGWAFTEYKSPQGSWLTGIGDDDKYYITNSTSLTTNPSFVIDDANQNVGIATTSPSANADLTLGNGELCMAETTTPTADANFGKIYCKSDNKLYFQDGAGTEHEIAFV